MAAEALAMPAMPATTEYRIEGEKRAISSIRQWLKHLESLRSTGSYVDLVNLGVCLISPSSDDHAKIDTPECLSLKILQEMIGTTASINLRLAGIFHGIDNVIMAKILASYWGELPKSEVDFLEEIERIAVLEHGFFLMDALWVINIPLSLQIRMIESFPVAAWLNPISKFSTSKFEDHPARILSLLAITSEPVFILNNITRSDIISLLISKAYDHLPVDLLRNEGGAIWRNLVLCSELGI